jgi:hypothetical protein
MDPSQIETLGIEDNGKWMPFVFHMDMVEAAKLTSEDESSSLYNCTTVFTRGGDAYIIDTNYREFFNLFKEYNLEISDDNDLDL